MTNSVLTQDEIQALLRREQQRQATSGSGPRTSFLKLSATNTMIRILPSNPFFYAVRKHTYRADGKFVNALDFNFIIAEAERAEKVLSVSNLTPADLNLAAQFGDPITAIGNAAREPMKEQVLSALKVEAQSEKSDWYGKSDSELDKEADSRTGRKLSSMGIWPQTKYLWNVVNRDDGSVYKLETSQNFFQAISAMISATHPNLLDAEHGHDVLIQGNGKNGKERRYVAFLPKNDPSPIGVSGWESMCTDLEKFCLRGAVPWQEKAAYAEARYADLLSLIGSKPWEKAA